MRPPSIFRLATFVTLGFAAALVAPVGTAEARIVFDARGASVEGPELTAPARRAAPAAAAKSAAVQQRVEGKAATNLRRSATGITVLGPEAG